MKGFALGLIMKMTVFGTLKWCILSQLLGNSKGEKYVFLSPFFFTLVKLFFGGFVYLVLSGRVQIIMDFHTDAVTRRGE